MIRLGRYTVVQRLRFDNPAWPQYVIFAGDKLVGKSFSMPDEGWCQFLEQQGIARAEWFKQESEYRPFALRGRGISRPSPKRHAWLPAEETIT